MRWSTGSFVFGLLAGAGLAALPFLLSGDRAPGPRGAPTADDGVTPDHAPAYEEALARAPLPGGDLGDDEEAEDTAVTAAPTPLTGGVVPGFGRNDNRSFFKGRPGRRHAEPLDACLEAARRHLRAGLPSEPGDIRALLDAEAQGDVLTGIGLAVEGGTDTGLPLLLAVATDPSHGSMRIPALHGIVRLDHDAPPVAAAVLAAAEDDDLAVRSTALRLHADLGPAGVENAVALLRRGNLAEEILVPLAACAADAGRALEVLVSVPPADSAAALLFVLAHRDTVPEEEIERLRSLAPGIVRPWLRSPCAADLGPGMLDVFVRLGDVSFLGEVALSSDLPPSLRMQALERVVRVDAAGAGVDLRAALLLDSGSPSSMVRQLLGGLGAGDLVDDRLRYAVFRLASDHADPWVRADADAVVASIERRPGPDLVILSALYGRDGTTVDVAPALSALIHRGHLVTTASNSLAGDPLVGTRKELAITWSWMGRRRSAVYGEGERVSLP